MPDLQELFNQYGTIIYLGVLVAVFYFFMIRPQQKQQKTRMEMLSKLNKGDKIINHGGVIGTITEINEDNLIVRIAEKTEVKMLREGVAKVINK